MYGFVLCFIAAVRVLACGALLLQVEDDWNRKKDSLYSSATFTKRGLKRSFMDQGNDVVKTMKSGHLDIHMKPESMNDSTTGNWNEVA